MLFGERVDRGGDPRAIETVVGFGPVLGHDTVHHPPISDGADAVTGQSEITAALRRILRASTTALPVLPVNCLKQHGVFEVERISSPDRSSDIGAVFHYIRWAIASGREQNGRRHTPRHAGPDQGALQVRSKDGDDHADGASGSIENEGIACKVETGRALAVAGLHPGTGGSGLELCSGDMLLEALVACAGVTLKSVATAIEVPLKAGNVTAEGDLDFRGTLGVDKEAPVGFAEIRLRFDVDTDAPQDKLDLLLKLTERYCVVYQTIKNGPKVSVSMQRM